MQTFEPGNHDTIFKKLIDENYRYRLYLDDLPNRSMYEKFDQGRIDHPNSKNLGLHDSYSAGLPLGDKITIDGKERYIIFNHWKITVKTKKIKGENRYEIL